MISYAIIAQKSSGRWNFADNKCYITFQKLFHIFLLLLKKERKYYYIEY